LDQTTYLYLLKERLAKSGETSAARAAGSCMAPRIVSGMRLHIVSLEDDDPRLGQIYGFQYKGKLFSHRFVGRHGDALLFRGGRTNKGQVQKVEDREAILGRVDGVVLFGQIVRFDTTLGRLMRAGLFLAYGTFLNLPAPLARRLAKPIKRLL
jgi:hypothetical protein